MTTNDVLKQGIAALNAGRKAEARNLLTQVVQQDDRNEMAWLWLSGAMDTDEDRRICLENVLAINPNNGVAQRGIETLRKNSSELTNISSDAAARKGESVLRPVAETKTGVWSQSTRGLLLPLDKKTKEEKAMEVPQEDRKEGTKQESSMTLIDKYEEDYKSALASIETDVKGLIESGREMRGLMLFSESISRIVEIHDSLNDFYKIIFTGQEVLKRFNSERLRQLGYEPIALYEQHRDAVTTSISRIAKENVVVRELSKIGFNRTHWWIKTRILNEIEYLIEALRILIEPEFIPFEEIEIDQEKPDRYIPSSVKIAVWRRDGGKCVECGSKEKLEYDHIIPVSKGGSSTERNIQLLCEKCNRKKSASIE